jgi:hypothetical protein
MMKPNIGSTETQLTNGVAPSHPTMLVVFPILVYILKGRQCFIYTTKDQDSPKKKKKKKLA